MGNCGSGGRETLAQWQDYLGALDARATACAGELSRSGEPVRYLGSVLMREDEVVL